MIIHCDGCGAEVEKDRAIPFSAEEGVPAWFCSEACRDLCRHLTPVEPPDAMDRGAGSALPIDEDAGARPPDPLR